jgi:hypothetical protein
MIFVSVQMSFAQVTVTVSGNTNTTPNLATSYSSLSAAITALNTVTAVSGQVTLTCASGGAETAPPGGYRIIYAATTTATNNIVIDGNGSTITASASQTVGRLYDAIFKIEQDLITWY